MSGVLLRGGGSTKSEGDVRINVPTANLGSQALMTSPKIHGLLIPKERDADEAQLCTRCRSRLTYTAVEIHFKADDGYAIRLCNECCAARIPGDPIIVNLAKVE